MHSFPHHTRRDAPAGSADNAGEDSEYFQYNVEEVFRVREVSRRPTPIRDILNIVGKVRIWSILRIAGKDLE